MIRLLKTITLVALTAVSTAVSAQDLLANKAPSDRTLKDLKTIKINNTPAFVDLHNPAGEIYTTWDHTSALIAPGVMPPNFKVDLRGFAMPTPSRKITSKFGPRWGRQHKGLDIKVYIGDTIYAAFDGKVRIVKYNAGGWGYYVVLRHPNGLETLYGHLSKQLVKEDEIVRAGQPIGLGGNSGASTGSHLHFETRLLGTAINPALMFDFEAQDVTGDYYVVNSGKIQNAKNTVVATAPKEEETAPVSQNIVIQLPAATPKAPAIAPAATETQAPATPKQPESKTPKELTYVVKKGDTPYSIAKNHGISLDQLYKLNGLKPGANIKAGQVLKCS
ncbi:MAG: peptidoglycan DD-metalloendopeptidase family protein [Bacteroidaceae bacterium]|nr:peptidoglycan DD-metalloendopeptidase family protein [Bacteroidaceae bacterium]